MMVYDVRNHANRSADGREAGRRLAGRCVHAASLMSQLRKSSSAASQIFQLAAIRAFVGSSRCPFPCPFHAGWFIGGSQHPDARASNKSASNRRNSDRVRRADVVGPGRAVVATGLATSSFKSSAGPVPCRVRGSTRPAWRFRPMRPAAHGRRIPLANHILTIKMKMARIDTISWTRPTPVPTSSRARSTC